MKKNIVLTLNVEYDAVCKAFCTVRDDAGELLTMGLAAGQYDIVTAHGHGAIRIARFLKRGFALQSGVPFNDAGRLAVSRHAGGHRHLAFRHPCHDGGWSQGHLGHWPCWKKEVNNKKQEKKHYKILKYCVNRGALEKVSFSHWSSAWNTNLTVLKSIFFPVSINQAVH